MPSTTPLVAPKALVTLGVPSLVLSTALSCHFPLVSLRVPSLVLSTLVIFPLVSCLHMAINSKYISSGLTLHSFLTQGSGLDIQQAARSSDLVENRAMKAQYIQTWTTLHFCWTWSSFCGPQLTVLAAALLPWSFSHPQLLPNPHIQSVSKCQPVLLSTYFSKSLQPLCQTDSALNHL